MTDEPFTTAATDGWAMCGCCGSRASFAVASDAVSHYSCARHLAHHVRLLQAQEPLQWFKVCELTDE